MSTPRAAVAAAAGVAAAALGGVVVARVPEAALDLVVAALDLAVARDPVAVSVALDLAGVVRDLAAGSPHSAEVRDLEGPAVDPQSAEAVSAAQAADRAWEAADLTSAVDPVMVAAVVQTSAEAPAGLAVRTGRTSAAERRT